MIRLLVTSIDMGPPELEEQLPLSVTLLRELPGPDRRDYWLGRVEPQIRWRKDGATSLIGHVIVCTRWTGQSTTSLIGDMSMNGCSADNSFPTGRSDIALNLAYVVDESLVSAAKLEFAKCAYMAVCFASAERVDSKLR